MKNLACSARLAQAAFALALLSGRLALAQPSTNAEYNAAVDRGTKAAKKNDRRTAIDAWKQADAIQPSWWLACSVGRLSLRTGELVQAAKYLNRCVRTAPPPRSEEWIKQRGEELLELETVKLHLVTVEVEAEEGASIYANGELEDVAPCKYPVFVAPGQIKIEARKDGESITRAFEAERGTKRAIVLTRPPKPASVAPPAPVTAPKERPAPPLPAPIANPVRLELPTLQNSPGAWSTWQHAMRSDAYLFTMAGVLFTGFYFDLVEDAQQDAHTKQLSLAVAYTRAGLYVDAASALESAKSANFWRAVCAGLYPVFYGAAGAMLGARLGMIALNNVSIGRDSAFIQGSFQW